MFCSQLQHTVMQLLRLVVFFGNRLFPPPPGGLAEYIEGSQSDAAAAATVADAAQPPELRSRLRAVTMNSGADPDLARRMLEGYLTVRESLERREGLYTVIGHAESADGTPVMPSGALGHGRARAAQSSGLPAQHPPEAPHAGNDNGFGTATGMRWPAAGNLQQRAGSSAAARGHAGAGRSRDSGGGVVEGGGQAFARGPRHFEQGGDAAEATLSSELVAMALSSPLLGMLAAGGLEGPGSAFPGDADASAGDHADHQSQ